MMVIMVALIRRSFSLRDCLIFDVAVWVLLRWAYAPDHN